MIDKMDKPGKEKNFADSRVEKNDAIGRELYLLGERMKTGAERLDKTLAEIATREAELPVVKDEGKRAVLKALYEQERQAAFGKFMEYREALQAEIDRLSKEISHDS